MSKGRGGQNTACIEGEGSKSRGRRLTEKEEGKRAQGDETSGTGEAGRRGRQLGTSGGDLRRVGVTWLGWVE